MPLKIKKLVNIEFTSLSAEKEGLNKNMIPVGES